MCSNRKILKQKIAENFNSYAEISIFFTQITILSLVFAISSQVKNPCALFGMMKPNISCFLGLTLYISKREKKTRNVCA